MQNRLARRGCPCRPSPVGTRLEMPSVSDGDSAEQTRTSIGNRPGENGHKAAVHGRADAGRLLRRLCEADWDEQRKTTGPNRQRNGSLKGKYFRIGAAYDSV